MSEKGEMGKAILSTGLFSILLPVAMQLLYEGLSFQRGENMLEGCDCGGPLGSRGPTPQSPWTPVEL
ncbi:unnamed protein product [Arctogadus glacialis]